MKLKHLIASGLAICGLLTGCLSEPDFEPVLDDNGNPLEVHLFNEIKQVPVTRVNDEGFCNGDQVGVYVVNYVDGAPGTLAVKDNQADNVKYTLEQADLGGGVWKPEAPVYYLDKTTKVDIYGYYPYAEPTDVKAYPFEIAKDQSRDAENGKLGGYEASDFLWAKASEISPTASKIVLTFNHIMAGVNVTIVEGEGFTDGEFSGLDKSVLVTNTKRQTTIDFSTGTVTAVGDMPATGTIPYKKGDDFRAIVAPQTVAANTPLFTLTVGGLPYVFSKSEDFEYSAGKLHNFTIKVDKKEGGSVEFEVLSESIKAWESENITHDGEAREYVVVNCTEAGKLKEAIVAAGMDYTKVKNLKITGKVNANDFYFMRDQMTLIQAINMKDVKILGISISGYKYEEDWIPMCAFEEKKSLMHFVFPDNIIGIDSQCFNRTNLTGSLIIPEGVKCIGSQSFAGTRLDGSLSLPSTLEIIEYAAFSGCSRLIGDITLPENLIKINNSAFAGCRNLSGNLILPNNLEFLGDSAFSGLGISGEVRIPPSILHLSNHVFSFCENLKSVIFHDNLLTIGDGAFTESSLIGELVLPQSLTSIGGGAFARTDISSITFSENIEFIGNDAFSECFKLSGTICLPHKLGSIAENLFFNSNCINEIIIPKDVIFIGSHAFGYCYNLNSIVSHAQIPPTVAAGAFDGVAKANFTVEVPEVVVNNYQTAPGWKDFQRISAHHDFSISRGKFRTLNAADSKILTLRAPAGASWKVESCPDWVTVSPNEGVGKQDVTVTVNEMIPSAAETVTYEQMNSSGNYENVSFTGRRDEVVFLLEDKDYRSTMIVEQYNYAPEGAVIGDGYVIKNHAASKGQKGVNLVFMGDCFDAKDISEGKYLDATNEAIEHFFDLAPYKQYKDYFNVYTVVGLSSDSGVGTVNTIREAKFGSQYGLQGSGEIAPDAATCFEYACKTPTVTEDNINKTLIVMIENSTEYDGICYMYGDGSAIALCPMSNDVYPYDFRGIVQHEAGGHGFGKLADEYIYHNAFIQSCSCTDGCGHVDEFNAGKSRGWYENLSLSGNMYDVPWSHFIFDPQYSNVVDIYEGGYFHTRGVFRSEPNSCMNNNVPYYSAVSREAIVKRIMEYAGEEYSFEAFKAKDVMSAKKDEATKSGIIGMGMSFPARQQHCPVYMGEKPEFKKN